MTRLLLGLLLLSPVGCASNQSDTAGARIQDTTTTAQDTINPNDTLPRVRDSAIDSM
jgi:type IV pilus biogenesis protein CpaD/CtpE